METPRVLLVDDHPVFAEALAARLGGEPGLAIVPVAHTVGQALTELARSRPTVVVLDLVLGGESGLTVLERARAGYPDSEVIMLSAVDSVETVVEAVRCGARAWLPKSVEIEQLIRVIHTVAQGGAWLPPAQLRAVLTGLTETAPAEADPLAALTPRERDVLQGLIDGLSRAEIARRLYLSTNTVRTHTQNLLAKLDSHSALEAVAVARRAGMRHSGGSSGPSGTGGPRAASGA